MRKTPDPLRGILAVICVVLLCILLTAGLWPFHAPDNDITWLPGGGLEFGSHATILGFGGLSMPRAEMEHTCSLEIWLHPLDLSSGSTLITFDTPNVHHFSLRQSDPDLELRSGARRFFIERFFHVGQSAFITITAGAKGTSVYRNGVFVRTFSELRVSRDDLSGRVVLGNSLGQKDSFSGILRGLALYGQALSQAQIDQDFQTWTQTGRPEIASDARPMALYLFNEGRGSVVHDSGTSGVNLNIPAHFVVVHQKFLERPWTEFHPDWNYVKDILINVGGFIPWGFFVLALLSTHATKRPVLFSVLAGFGVSLTIEVLQSFLPTRYSGITDLGTNTFGTWLGTLLYRWVAQRTTLAAKLLS